jgi:hypothetical protein
MTKRFGVPLGLAGLLVSLLCLGAIAWAADEGEEKPVPAGAAASAGNTSSSASDREVVIRGESRLRVKVEKPEPDLTFDVDEIAVPAVVTEDYVLDVSPTSIAHPSVLVATYLNSSQTASPFIQMFKRPPILRLRPKYKNQGSIARWRLRVTDGFGNVYKDFSGKNSLPEEILWDGRAGTAEGDMADVGTSYSYIFSVVDEASNPTSQMGRPIVMESLLYEDATGLTGKVTAEAMFQKKERKTGISPKGELYCREVADLLTARQSFPLVIESYAKDVDAATSNGEIVQEYLAQRYTLPKEKLKIVAFKARLEKIVFKIR